MKKFKNQTKFVRRALLVIHFFISVVLIIFASGALRQNNLKMLSLREEVFKADQSGVGIDESLKNLQNFVTTHMNTRLPRLGAAKPIQLKYSYERATQKELQRFQDESKNLSLKAKSVCSGIRTELLKVDCEQAYIKNNPVSPLVNYYPEQFSIDFVSPRWTFDLAGWLITLSFISTLVLLVRIVLMIKNKKHPHK